MLPRLCFTCLLCVLLLVTRGVAEPVLSFTAIPDENTTRLEERFSGVAKYLSNALGVPVHYIPVKSYAASVTAFKNNTVQLAWFGGLSGVQARQAVPGSQAIAQGTEDAHFKTYFIAHHSTGLTPTSDFPMGIAGKTFLFGSQSSTSGRLMPEFYVRKYFQKPPAAVFDRIGFSGDHSKTIALVQAGSYAVGVVNYVVWDAGVADGTIDTSRVRVIWTTPEYPDYNWTVRGDVDTRFRPGFMNDIKQALLELTDTELLQSFPRSAFIPATNDLYTPIERTGAALGIIRK